MVADVWNSMAKAMNMLAVRKVSFLFIGRVPFVMWDRTIQVRTGYAAVSHLTGQEFKVS